MKTTEVVQLAGIFCAMGIEKIRLTGGEPLIRKDAGRVLQLLSALPAALYISTNGTQIHRFIPQLQEARVKGVNISLDTLQPATFQQLTRRDAWHQVRRNIDLLLQHQIPVKINVVVMKGVNDQELPDFAAWTKHAPIDIRFIEYMPFTQNHWEYGQVYSHNEILQQLQQYYTLLPQATDIHATTCTYRIPGHAGTLSVISTITQPFCSSCNRLRLTADGKLKNCLFSAGETDLLSALRNGEALEPLIQQNLLTKAAERGGQFTAQPSVLNARQIINRSMIAIGG